MSDLREQAAQSESWIGARAMPADLDRFARRLEATLRVLAATRLRVSIVAVECAGFDAARLARAVYRALGAQEPLAEAVGGGVIFLYVGPRLNSERGDDALANRLARLMRRAAAELGASEAALEIACTHLWSDETSDIADLVAALHRA